MTAKIISRVKSAFLRFDLENGNARQQKAALQELCQLYRQGYLLNAEDRNGVEIAIDGIIWTVFDKKVIRWGLNALAQFGKPAQSTKYVEVVLNNHANDPEIVAAGVAALAHMYRGDIESLAILFDVDPAIRTLAALQNTDPKYLDLSTFKIDVDNSNPEVLKLALITVGLNKDVENLFHPRHENGELVRILGQHPDDIVRQYSVWAVMENKRLNMSHLGIDYDDISKQTPNVQSKLLQLVAEKESEVKLKHHVILKGTYSTTVDAREGLAKGLRSIYYDGVQDIVIPWFDTESSATVKELIAEHVARHAAVCPSYEDKAMEIVEAEPKLLRRMLVGAERTKFYPILKACELDSGTGDLFELEKEGVIELLRAGKANNKPQKKVLLLSASPVDQESLRLDAEARDLREQLQLVKNPKVKINVENRWAVKVTQIQSEILNERPEVLHFSGHGDRNYLCFEDASGATVPVSAGAIAELVGLCDSIGCLVLSACYSSDIADRAVDKVDAVVGCKGAVADHAAVAFARAFYRALAHGKPYEAAYKLAKNEVRLTNGDDEADRFVFRSRSK